MVRINFNLRSNQPGKDSPINVVIRWNGQRLVVSSGQRIDPAKWSDTTQRAKKGLTGSADFNITLTNLQQSIESVFRNLFTKLQRSPSILELREAIDLQRNPGMSAATDLQQFVAEFIKNATSRINARNGKQLTFYTIRNYKTANMYLNGFLKQKRSKTALSDVDLAFYDKFVQYLINVRGLRINSVGQIIRVLKLFLSSAAEIGIDVNPAFKTKRFKAPTELTDKVYLSEQELNEIYQLDLSSIPRLENVRDLFLVGAWTGLRFQDFSTLKPENFVDDSIRINTNKTGKFVEIPLHPVVRSIFNKHNGKLPRSVQNQQMNRNLRELCSMLKCLQSVHMITSIKAGERKTESFKKYELISTHTARRSFATNLYKAECPVRSIMAITGHKTETSFRAYIRLNESEHADIVRSYMTRSTMQKVS